MKSKNRIIIKAKKVPIATCLKTLNLSSGKNRLTINPIIIGKRIIEVTAIIVNVIMPLYISSNTLIPPPAIEANGRRRNCAMISSRRNI
jgi:hypothetical protein